MLEPHETWKLIQEHHLPTLSELESRLLAASVAGWRAPAIARRLFRDERQTRKDLARLEDLVCVPVGAERNVALLAWWLGYHRDCSRRCAAAAQEMIETDTVFPPENTPATG